MHCKVSALFILFFTWKQVFKFEPNTAYHEYVNIPLIRFCERIFPRKTQNSAKASQVFKCVKFGVVVEIDDLRNFSLFDTPIFVKRDEFMNHPWMFLN